MPWRRLITSYRAAGRPARQPSDSRAWPCCCGYRPCQACLHMHEAAAPGRQVFSLGKMVFGLDIFDG